MTEARQDPDSAADLTTRPAALLRRLGVRARKGLSQSFLTDPGVCRAMAEAAELSSSDEVLEIGPGLGILTAVLLERAQRVVAVELDPLLAAQLPATVTNERLLVIQGDALQLDPRDYFAAAYKLIANLPYQITSPVLTRYLVDVRRPSSMVVMVQREVAERIVAPPGESNYLSIMVQCLAQARLVRRIPAGAFYPRPKVESAVVAIKPRDLVPLPEARLREFLTLVRAGFTQPRKTLANSLAQGLQVPRSEVEPRLRAAGLDPTTRPQELAVENWLALYQQGGEG